MVKLSNTVASRRCGNSRRLASAALLALTASFNPAQCFSSTANSFVPRPTSLTKTSTCASPAFDLRGGSLASSGRNLEQSRSKSSLQSAVTEPSTSEANKQDEMSTMKPSAKLEALRKSMKELDLDVYIQPSDDPHLSGKCCIEPLCPRAR